MDLVCALQCDTVKLHSTMSLKETLLQRREELLEQVETAQRHISEVEKILVSQCGWFRPLDLRSVDTSLPSIPYVQEGHAFVDHLESQISFGPLPTTFRTADFLQWLNIKYGEDVVNLNSARGAITSMERSKRIKVITPSRGRIGAIYETIVQ